MKPHLIIVACAIICILALVTHISISEMFAFLNLY